MDNITRIPSISAFFCEKVDSSLQKAKPKQNKTNQTKSNKKNPKQNKKNI